MNIGEASKATAISTKMIRYYEEVGVIRPALRSYSGYRVYSEKEVQILKFVRRARDLGFTVKQIVELLALWQDGERASADVKRIALEHVAELQIKMCELQEMVATLEHLAQHCHGDNRPDCPILMTLGSEAPDEAIPVKHTSALGRGFEARQ